MCSYVSVTSQVHSRCILYGIRKLVFGICKFCAVASNLLTFKGLVGSCGPVLHKQQKQRLVVFVEKKGTAKLRTLLPVFCHWQALLCL